MTTQHVDTKQSAIRRAVAGSLKDPAPVGSTLQERIEFFGLGACECTQDWEVPSSYNLDMMRCNYDRLPNSIVVPALAFVNLIVQPTIGSAWFCPCAWLATVRDSVDDNLERSAWFTDVTIGRCTLLPFSDRAPTIATTQFMRSSELDPANRDNCACPTPTWQCFSNVANSCTMNITIFNPNPMAIRASVEFLGKDVPSCLPKRQPQ